MSSNDDMWFGNCDLRLIKRPNIPALVTGVTSHQARCCAPFKLLRGSHDNDGRLEIPILHTAGGMVGGDNLSVTVKAEKGTSGLLTTAAAQKVYGSVGISKIHPEGAWARQQCGFEIEEGADLEWLPQELVLFGEGLYEQCVRVDLFPNSSFLSVEIVRLGRTAKGECLGKGCWRSRLEICRHYPDRNIWEFVDQLELGGDALSSDHGMANQPVLGSLVWVAPSWVSQEILNNLAQNSLEERFGLEGLMSCSVLDHGLSARYIGASTQAARFWFFRIWVLTRRYRKLCIPKPLRVWPMQEDPLCRNYVNKN